MDMKINWYPGHMNSSHRIMAEQIKKCDVIFYVLDARCPKSCLNPKFEELTKRKPVIFILNKADLAPESALQSIAHGIALDSTKSNTSKKLIVAVQKQFPNKTRIHAMVIGVPNCGKSTLINNLAGSGKALAANKPGVTRTTQWAQAKDSPLYLLDTPGVLYPSFDDQSVAKNLAYIGSIKDDILDFVELACELLVDINYPDTFEDFGKKRGYILKGGILDQERCARAILTEFRAGKFGKYNLDELL